LCRSQGPRPPKAPQERGGIALRGMRYVSTRGRSPVVGFPEVMLAGLAPDGGLYMPESWPDVLPLVDDQTYPELLARMMSPYVADSISAGDLLGMTQRATAVFPQPEVVPLREVGEGIFMLELFWGPTLAFKDLGLRMLAELFRQLEQRVLIIGATSGDTGSAAIQAFRGLPSVQVLVLHPEGLVSEVQRRQMTTVDGPNIHNIAVLGTFDDCQSLVKRLLADEDVRARTLVASANSINWLRIAAQTAYYVSAAARLGGVLDFSVPSGNFGNAFSGHAAFRMGAPIARIAVATNLNRGLADLLTTGAMTVGPPLRTMSPAMDIQLPSNLERALFEAFGRDPGALDGKLAAREWPLAHVPARRRRHSAGRGPPLCRPSRASAALLPGVAPLAPHGSPPGARVLRPL